MRLQAVAPAEIDVRGGQVVTLRGDFAQQVPLRVHFRASGGQQVQAYSGIAGQGPACYALGSLITCAAPAWPKTLSLPAAVDVQVAFADGSEAVWLHGALTIARPSFDSQTYALRGLYPPGYAAGARSIQDEQTHTMLPGALLEPLLSSFGETLGAYGGVRLTWLAADALAGEVTVTLSSAAGWPPSGRFMLGGIVYGYSSRQGEQLQGVKWRQAGVSFDGLATDALQGTQVTDASRTFSQLDMLRNAYFVQTAQGGDLSTCGRNYGLERDPAVPDDATFARALLCIAYGPRGTVLALKTALDALLGPGRYVLREDTLNHPCRVFIDIPQDMLRQGTTLGRSYPCGPRLVAATDAQTLTLAAPVYGCNRIAYPDQDVTTELANARPAAPWTFANGDEAQACQPHDDLPGLQRCTFMGGAGIYEGPAGIDPDAQAELTVCLRPESAPARAAGTSGFVACLSNGRNDLAVTLVVDAQGAVSAQACNASGVPTGQGTLPLPERLARVGVRWHGRAHAEMFVGRQTLRLSAPALPGSSSRKAFFGVPAAGASGSLAVGVRRAEYMVRPARNFAAAAGEAASVGVGSPDVHLDASFLTPAMLDSQLTLRGSSAARRAPGRTSGPAGNNDGDYALAAVASGMDATVGLWQRADGVLGSGAAGELRLPDAAFIYPRDLGRIVRVGGSTGNAGDYYIADLVDALGQVCTLPYRRACPWARLVKGDGQTASFTSQPKAQVTLLPTFVAETSLRWSVPNALRREAQGADVLLRTPLPLPDAMATYAVTYDDTLGCIVVKTSLPEAFVTDEGPPVLWSTYPLYVADPLIFVGNYISQLSAAGVRPVFGGVLNA